MRVCAFALVALATLTPWLGARMSAAEFDHDYRAYADVLRAFVHDARVDYRALARDRARLDRVLDSWNVPATTEQGWNREQRLAFWVNAYNAFTLRAIVDHYPIRAGWFTRGPRNSIRQIDGVWTALKWRVAERVLALDDIEHRILRPEFGDARVHFAITCASTSCPPLAAEPYRASTVSAQLDAAARRYLASSEGLRVRRDTLEVSSIFKWYGDDFISAYAPLVAGERDARERAILGAIVSFGPSEAAGQARGGRARIAYLDYDWSLNDIAGPKTH